MDKEKAIREIVGSYDITSNLKEKIIRIAVEKTDDLHINGFDNLYNYVATLVDKFKYFYSSKFLVNLDSSIKNSEQTLHKIIGLEDDNLKYLFKDEEFSENYESFNILKNKLNKKYFDILDQLIENLDKDVLLEIFSSHPTNKYLQENINKIQEKLEDLVSTYGKNGKLIIPKRPIISVQFHPIEIKFKRRNFKGNPLSFFKENIDIYGRMSKSALQEFDSGLYSSLLRHGQMNAAIPKYRGYNSPLAYFFANKNTKYKSMSRTQLKNADPALYEILRKNKELKMAISQKRKQFFKGYDSPLDYFEANIKKYNGLSRTQLKKFDKKLYYRLYYHNQLEEAIPYSLRKTLSREQIIKIRKTLLKNRGLIKKTVRETGHSRQAVRKYGKVLRIFNNS